MSNFKNLLNAREYLVGARTELIAASNELKQTKFFALTLEEIDDTINDITASIDHLTHFLK